MLVLDSTVFIAALDRSRSSHLAARSIISSGKTLAVTTQTMRESLAVATRPISANGLGLAFPLAWASITAMRMACSRLLHENDKWWSAYSALAQELQPTGRTLFDLGQVAFVHSLGPTATLLTDDDRLVARYSTVIAATTIATLSAASLNENPLVAGH